MCGSRVLPDGRSRTFHFLSRTSRPDIEHVGCFRRLPIDDSSISQDAADLFLYGVLLALFYVISFRF